MQQTDPHKFDERALGAFLEENMQGFSNLKSVTKFNDGQSNPTYLLEAETGKCVLRAKPPGKLLKSAHAVDREYRIMRALKNSPVPVPKMFYLCEDDAPNNPLGRMFFIMEYLDGRILWDPLLSDLEKDTRREIYHNMNKALAQLHGVDIKSAGLEDFGKSGSYFERQFSRWTGQYELSATQTIPAMEELIRWLDKNMVEDDGASSIVHGDYRMDNMIFAKNSNEIIALLDWELSTLGHPFADLAYQCMQWRMPNESALRGLGNCDREKLGIPLEKDYVKLYCQHRNISAIDNWEFYLAFSFFRLAAIIQGVVKRAEQGNASNPKRHEEMAKAVPFLAQYAVNMLRDEF